jgi:hypothetical protein
MSFTADLLDIELTKRHIYLDDNINWTLLKKTKKLGDHYLANHRDKLNFGTAYMQYLENPMLIKHYKDFEKYYTEENNPFNSNDWISEIKENGDRFLLTFDPEIGFQIFSRNEVKGTFLRGDFTEHILFIKNGLVRSPKDFIGAFNYRFIIEGEILVDVDNTRFEGVEYNNVVDYIQAILGALPERAKNHQKQGNTLLFKVFDVIYFEKDPKPIELPKYEYKNDGVTEEEAQWVLTHFAEYLESSGFDLSIPKKGKKKFWEKDPGKKIFTYLASLKNTPKYDVRKYSFERRRQLRESIVKFLQKNNLPFESIETEEVNKIEFIENLIREGVEGGILKNKKAPYFSSLKESRSHRASYKVKSSIAKMLENKGIYEDFDAYITGYELPKSKKIKDMIGAVKFSIYLVNEEGETVEHEIANIGGIPHETKREMTKVDKFGNISLKEEYIGRVIAIDGFSISPQSLRFSHAKLRNNTLEYKDKEPVDCCYDIQSLKEMISIRGK